MRREIRLEVVLVVEDAGGVGRPTAAEVCQVAAASVADLGHAHSLASALEGVYRTSFAAARAEVRMVSEGFGESVSKR